MIFKVRNFVAIMSFVIVLSYFFAAFMPTSSILADHTSAHCSLQFTDPTEIENCINNVPQTTQEKIDYCLGINSDANSLEYTDCIAEFADNEAASFDTDPTVAQENCVDRGTFATTELNSLKSVNIDTSNNPFYLKLVQIVNFASIGVAIIASISVGVGGLQYVTSRGNQAQTKKAIGRITQAGTAIGLYVFGWTLLNWMVPGGILYNRSADGADQVAVANQDSPEPVNFCPEPPVPAIAENYDVYFGDAVQTTFISENPEQDFNISSGGSIGPDGPFDNGVLSDEIITLLTGDYTINFPRSNVISTYWKPGLSPAQRIFTIFCDYSHSLKDDPIVYPGQPGVSHSHDFLGNNALDAFSTTQSLLDHGVNSCRVPEDRSAYWSPTVYDNGRVHHPAASKFYYRSGKLDPKSIQPMPVGLMMIAGNAKATSNQSERVGKYFTALLGPMSSPATQSTVGATKMMKTNNSIEQGVRLDVHFPSCWDGKNLWLPGSTHVTYHDNGANGGPYAKCPASHPVPIIEITYNLHFPEADGGEDFYLSSGPWYTFHSDFINGWHPATLEALTRTCIQSSRYCQAVDNFSCDVRFSRPLSPVPTNNCVEIYGDGRIVERVRGGGAGIQ